MDLPRHGATIRKEFEIAGIKGNRCAEIKVYNPHTVLLNWNGKDWI
jgi:hypothetical protein